MINVAVIGTGNIGTDLLKKIHRSSYLNCVLFSGRRASSKGLQLANNMGVNTSHRGINAVMDMLHEIDVLFDCSSAESHNHHWELIKESHVRVIDLTPSNIGIPIVPSVNLELARDAQNISLVTCGGQGGIPLASAITEAVSDIEYLEVVNTISSKSAGPATRMNLDEYLATTESVMSEVTGVARTKSILVLNPAEPCINMKTTLFAITNTEVDELAQNAVVRNLDAMIRDIKKFVPGYNLILAPTFDGHRIVITIEVKGQGDYLPEYAGNLDIITCASIRVAEFLAVSEERKIANG